MATIAPPTAPEHLVGLLNEVKRYNAPEQLFAAGDGSLLRQGVRVAVVG